MVSNELNVNKNRNADILLVDVSPYMYVVSVFFRMELFII